MFFETHNQVPDIYTTESRDFQLIESLFDILCNTGISNSEGIKFAHFPLKVSDNLLKSLCQYEGFFTDIYYPGELLRSILLNFPYFIKIKGTTESIEQAVKALQSVYSNRVSVTVSKSLDHPSDPHRLTIYLSGDSSRHVNRVYIDDLLRYVKPVGIIIDDVLLRPIDLPSTAIQITDPLIVLAYMGEESVESDTSYYLHGQIRRDYNLPANIQITGEGGTAATNLAQNVLSGISHTQITHTRSFIKTIKGDIL